jgi:hypothetical protein
MLPTPGDIIEFGDLSLRFLVDENLENYMEIQNWIRGLGFPENLQQFDDLEKSGAVQGTFDATETDIQYFTADVSFKYTIYNIYDLQGNKL